MRILIVTGIYPPDVGGPATYSALLEKEFPKRGVSVRVVTYGELHTRAWFVRQFLYFLRVLSASRQADILYAQDALNSGISAWISARIFRKKFILKIVGDYAWEQGVQRFDVYDLLDDFLEKRYGIMVSIFKVLRSFIAKRADLIIVPSHYLSEVVKKWGVGAEKIHVIYNTVPAPRLPRNRSKENILFSAGRDVPWKGFKMLSELNISGAKIITGSFPKEEYEKLLASCTIFLLNTGYEGFSHQILEAMSLGLPIIMTNAGGNKEIIEDEKNALVVEYNNKEAWTRAITRLLGDENLQKKLSENAKITAQKFLARDIIGETLKVLENVLNAK